MLVWPGSGVKHEQDPKSTVGYIYNRLQRALGNRSSGPSPEEHPRDNTSERSAPGPREQESSITPSVSSVILALAPDFLAQLLSSLHSVSSITASFLSLSSCTEKKRAAGATVSDSGTVVLQVFTGTTCVFQVKGDLGFAHGSSDHFQQKNCAFIICFCWIIKLINILAHSHRRPQHFNF